MYMSTKARTERALLEISRGVHSDQILTDPDVLASYARDESETEPTLPDAVVRVRAHADVIRVMQAASKHGAYVTPRGAGTGRTGGAVPVRGGIVLAFEGMNQLEEVHRTDLVAVVQPGLVLKDLHQSVEAEGLFYGPDPNSLTTCALGGNLAENAGGPRAFKYGVTRDWTLGLEVVTADGTPLSLGKRTVKGVTGYDLAALVVGSEGTLVTVLRAELELVPVVNARALVVLGYPDIAAAADAVPKVLEHDPIALEGVDHYLVRDEQLAGLNPDGLAELPDSRLPVAASLDVLDGLHARWTALWRALDASAFARRFRHPEIEGPVTLDRHLALYSWHCRHHVAHITALRQREGW